MKILKKTGWFFVSMLPAILSLLLQIGCAAAAIIICILWLQAQGAGASYDELINTAYDWFMVNAIYAVMLYHIIGVIIFGLWYYLAYGRKKRPVYAEKPDAKKIAMIILLAVSAQIFINGIINIIYNFKPELLESYIELMELSGITEFTIAAAVATVILAPIGEELLCRGIIFRIAGKVSKRFWVVNCIQALAFGLIHGNLVQGTYAFFIGLILGYIYGKYSNIWICMLLHGAFNLLSGFMDSYFAIFPEQYEIPVLIGNVIVALILMILCFKGLGKRQCLQEEDRESCQS